MKKIMILGAAYTQLPLVRAAKNLGYQTAVASIPGDYPCFELADEVVYADISKPEEVLAKARSCRIDGIATCGLDLGMRSIGAVCQALKLPGPDAPAAQRAGNKFFMKQALTKAGVSTAKFLLLKGEQDINEALRQLSFPLMLKAVDQMGGRGIFKCHTPEEVYENYKKTMQASREDYCIIEEFIEGTLFGVEGMIQNGSLLYALPDNTLAFHGAIDTPIGHSLPFARPELEGQIQAQLLLAIKALGLDNCPFNCDMIYRDDQVYLVEMTGRSGATGLSEMIGTWFGINYYESIVKLAMGEDVEDDFLHPVKIPCLSRTLISSRSGILEKIENRNLPDEDILDLSFNVRPGDPVHAYTNGRDRIGQLFLKAKTPEILYKKADRLLSGIYMELAGDLSLPETPVNSLAYFSEKYKNRIFIKREDLLPFSLGGNKVRFARAFLEDMEKKECDAMIIYGNYHSNLCRILSALCYRKKIPCSMINNVDDLSSEESSANACLIRMTDVREYACHKNTIAETVARARQDLKEQGCHPYYIYGNDLGQGNAHVPMRAYALVYEEILRQEKKQNTHFDRIYLASSTNTTQSGLIAGMIQSEAGRKMPKEMQKERQKEIIGISVSRNQKRARQVMSGNLADYFGDRKLPEDFSDRIVIFDEYLEGGYGQGSDREKELLRELYEKEGICLDPVYAGKAFYGMIRDLEKRKISGENILFLHTGGLPLFFDALPGIAAASKSAPESVGDHFTLPDDCEKIT